MPKPTKGEKRSDYISRCVKEVMGEGKSQDQALGKCYGMWSESQKANNMEILTVNFDSSKVRKAELDGKPYLVVPMVMMVEGVHNGSNGPLYYPGEELDKWSASWNHKPIVIYHPKEGSANEVDNLERSRVGIALNVTYSDSKQKGEAWLDEEVLKKKAPKVLNFIMEGKTVEVSTGLMVDLVGDPDEFKGKKYTAKAINHRPDHLAILPDQTGACSIKDGCGLISNSMPDGSLAIDNEDQLKDAIKLVTNRAGRRHVVRRAKVLNLSSLIPDGWKKGESKEETNVANELSHDEIRMELATALHGMYMDQMEKMPSLYPPYLRAVFDRSCIYSFGGNLYEISYSSSRDDVSLTGEPTQVEEKVEYLPVKNSSTTEADMCVKKDLVDKIINAKNSTFKESDRKTLEGLDDKILNAMIPTEKSQAEKDAEAEAVRNAEAKKKADEEAAAKKRQEEEDAKKKATENAAKPKTPQEWLNEAPPEVRQVVLNGMNMYKAETDRLIGIILANEAAKVFFKSEDLAKKSVDELRVLANMAAPVASSDVNLNTLGSYFGAGAPTVQNQHKEEALPLPVYNFSEKK